MQIGRQPQVQARVSPDSVDREAEAIHVVRAKAGDTEAFTWLMVRHERSLLYYVRRLVPRPEDALDVHQEVWLAVFRGLPALRLPRAFRAWLYRVAHDKAVRFIHNDVREAQGRESLDCANENDAGWTNEDPERIHRALTQLPPSQREVLTLFYLRELSLEEISHACNASSGTIKSRLHYARLALRRHLERNEHDDS